MPPSGAPAGSSAAPDNTALEQQVRAYSTAFLAGDGDAAYDLLSQRCKERNTRPNFVTLVQQAGTTYGPQEMRSLKVDQAAGDLARVTYTYDRAELDQRGEPWVRESGVWRIDDCG
ncbi:nuclear transport factor 2 family protein [Lentzea sp. NPDC058436]|uniref:nuclear transport factor 2 family protein n=1 Tax=Lentzea sp. NPDC058436 TaxID=3346499 RepID=UPI003647426C